MKGSGMGLNNLFSAWEPAPTISLCFFKVFLSCFFFVQKYEFLFTPPGVSLLEENVGLRHSPYLTTYIL